MVNFISLTILSPLSTYTSTVLAPLPKENIPHKNEGKKISAHSPRSTVVVSGSSTAHAYFISITTRHPIAYFPLEFTFSWVKK
ncbi:hypothetical protein BDZ91DRAFT_132404 [Kalaharituber pfeilii]|nr:hypothetical protein BDZ91DRAFT_132404 [Kalaharituber pfeilii]